MREMSVEPGGNILFNISKLVLSLAVIVLSMYSFIADKPVLLPYAMIVFSLLLLFTGITRLKSGRKLITGNISIILSILVFIIAVLGLIFNAQG